MLEICSIVTHLPHIVQGNTGLLIQLEEQQIGK